MESVDAGVNGFKTRYLGSIGQFVDFLLSAHITSLVIAMLLYANERLFPIMFAVAVAIALLGLSEIPDRIQILKPLVDKGSISPL